MGEQRCSLFKRWNVRPEDNVSATFSKAYKNTSLSARAQAVAEAERASVKTWAAALHETHALDLDKGKLTAAQ